MTSHGDAEPFFGVDEVVTWQREFPIHNTEADGHAGTAQVGSYPLTTTDSYDMVGNVWEWRPTDAKHTAPW